MGNAVASAYEIMLKQRSPDKWAELSRLFIYYNARELDNNTTRDDGAHVKDGLRAVKQWGVCTEAMWPYDITKFTVKPTPECYQDALKRTITKYYQLATVEDMVESLNNNHPVIVGMAVYESFDNVTRKNPVVPLPGPDEYLLGGHAVVVIGYDLERQQFLFKNSYGSDWGDGGYGWIPFEYIRSDGFEQWAFEISD